MAVVVNFIAAWNRRDRTAVMCAMYEDVICQGMPLPAAVGRAEAMALLDIFFTAEEIEWSICAIAACGSMVLTERVDRFRFAGRDWAEVRAMGVFEIDADGRIAGWRDYFDLGELERALPPGPALEDTSGFM